MVPYECPTCGDVLTLSADGWAWHRLVEHPRMGLPVHDPNLARMRALRRAPRRLVVSGRREPMAHPIEQRESLTARDIRRVDAAFAFLGAVLVVVLFVAIVAELSR